MQEVKKESKEVKETKSEPKEETSQPQRREKSAGNVANLVQRMSTIGIPTGGFQLPPPPPPAAAKSKIVFVWTVIIFGVVVGTNAIENSTILATKVGAFRARTSIQ